MPKNRQLIPREQRTDELLATATELLLTRGYTKTPMSDIANAAGVANAALYWYFPTKDDLLAAVWNRALDAELNLLAANPPSPDPFQQLFKGLTDLRPYRKLHTSMHDHLDSTAVKHAHDRLIDWVRAVAHQGLEHHGHHGQDADDIADLIVVLFEGLNVPQIQARTATEVIQTLLAGFLPSLRPVPRSRSPKLLTHDQDRATLAG
jgi:AcrR family transcriptional regulator